MKKNELLSALRSLQNNKNRTALAVTVGVMAMLLLLLSELLPSGNRRKPRHLLSGLLPSASTRPNWSSSWKSLSANCREQGAPRSWSP